MLDINRDKEYLSPLKFQLILCVLRLCGYSLVTQFRAFSLFVLRVQSWFFRLHFLVYRLYTFFSKSPLNLL